MSNITILNEQNQPIQNQESLDYNIGYLTKVSDGVFMYHLFTEKQMAERTIPQLKERLAETDYQAIKFAEGELSAEDYAEMKAQRAAWRAEINRLEAIINA